MKKGVITGDIVDSTQIPTEWKPTIIETLERVVSEFKLQVNISYEVFRGDSFQVVVDDITYVLSCAIAIRALLRANTPEGQDLWDARMAIGLGEVSFVSESIVTSDGEAFRNSGREFDALGKRRLAIVTPWEALNAELKLSTLFADDIISGWTLKQAEVVYSRIVSNASQKELSGQLGMSVQNFNKIWHLGRGALILSYIERYKELVRNYE